MGQLLAFDSNMATPHNRTGKSSIAARLLIAQNCKGNRLNIFLPSNLQWVLPHTLSKLCWRDRLGKRAG